MTVCGAQVLHASLEAASDRQPEISASITDPSMECYLYRLCHFYAVR